MTSRTAPPTGNVASRPPKRRLRNYLLDKRFQLKYTGYILILSVALTAVLGWQVYEASREASATALASSLGDPRADDDAFRQYLKEQFEATDNAVLVKITALLAGLVIGLALLGIFITHKVAGPIYKMKRLIGEVAAGRLRVEGGLRKGDELQDFFEAFHTMVDRLRSHEEHEMAAIESMIGKLEAGGDGKAALAELRVLRDGKKKALAS